MGLRTWRREGLAEIPGYCVSLYHLEKKMLEEIDSFVEQGYLVLAVRFWREDGESFSEITGQLADGKKPSIGRRTYIQNCFEQYDREFKPPFPSWMVSGHENQKANLQAA